MKFHIPNAGDSETVFDRYVEDYRQPTHEKKCRVIKCHVEAEADKPQPDDDVDQPVLLIILVGFLLKFFEILFLRHFVLLC